MLKGLMKTVKSSFRKWKSRGRDKKGKKALRNLGQTAGKK